LLDTRTAPANGGRKGRTCAVGAAPASTSSVSGAIGAATASGRPAGQSRAARSWLGGLVDTMASAIAASTIRRPRASVAAASRTSGASSSKATR
jgi:hypothetical protein